MDTRSYLAATRTTPIEAVRSGQRRQGEDIVAVEEPLEVRLAREAEAGAGRAISITMRTPGHDVELALGFLHGEGLIRGREDATSARPCGPSGNVVRVELAPHVALDLARLERHFYTSSSCGVCGKTSIEAVRATLPSQAVASSLTVPTERLSTLAGAARAEQDVFGKTGGLHAASLFDAEGHLLAVYEDVGRHNALDKLIGAQLLAGALPLARHVLLLSGRASFELVQKAAAAGIPVVVAIGAPSSLAIELAEDAGILLIGFLRGDSFNVYAHGERLK